MQLLLYQAHTDAARRPDITLADICIDHGHTELLRVKSVRKCRNRRGLANVDRSEQEEDKGFLIARKRIVYRFFVSLPLASHHIAIFIAERNRLVSEASLARLFTALFFQLHGR